MIRGIKKNGATPLDGYDFGYGGIVNRRSETRVGAHVFVEAEPGVPSVEADVPQGNTTARVTGGRQGNPLKLPVAWSNRVEFRSIRANGVGQPEFLRTLNQPVSVPEVRWTYTWDAQERLTAMETDPADVSKGAERRRLEFVYDAWGRRVVKRVRSGWTGLAYSRVEERRFVYDEGWNVLGETVSVNGAAPVLDRRYVWGLDLSGTEAGAGGVHGLVASVKPGAPAGARREPPVYDGNGNVERVVTEVGEVSARYEYGPFGEEITRRGVGAQPYRFSTKYHDEETGLLYYGYRYYAPRWGRWLSKDPIGERGGVNLYGMCNNNPVSIVDVDGRSTHAADSAAYAAIMDFLAGSGDLNREYGPDHAWTAEMQKHEHVIRVRNEIRSKIQAYCGGQRSGIVGVRVSKSWRLNDQSILTNARILFSDVLAAHGLRSPVYSTGSFAFQYTITSIACGSCTAKVDMSARDKLRLGSLTRIPFTNISIISDKNSANTLGNTINLYWFWNEEVSRK